MTHGEILANERRLLQLLCEGKSGVELRGEILERLRGYVFRSVEHQVLFECLRAMPFDRPELIPELLPARLVRAGFPDFDFAPFFDPPAEQHGLSADQARELCQALTDSPSTERRSATGERSA